MMEIKQKVINQGPIILVEDDRDDRVILESVFDDLHIVNKLVWFTNGREAFQYLKTTSEQPFLIMSDVILPGESGIEFKRSIDSDPRLRPKSIPFVFYSAFINQSSVDEAFLNMTVQGFFQKSTDYEAIRDTIKYIVGYWKMCYHPNTKQ